MSCQTVLHEIARECARQREIHPMRPHHPFHWNTVLTEEVLEALLEVTRLCQEHPDWATLVETRPSITRALRTELIQVAAVAASWAETLKEKE